MKLIGSFLNLALICSAYGAIDFDDVNETQFDLYDLDIARFKDVLESSEVIDELAPEDKKCLNHLRLIVNGEEKGQRWAKNWLNNWGHFAPSGLTVGNLYDLGNYDACIESKVEGALPKESFRSQYCMVPFAPKDQVERLKQTGYRELIMSNMALMIGVCMPDSCHPETVSHLFDVFVSKAGMGVVSSNMFRYCNQGKSEEQGGPFKDAYETIGGILVLLMIFSTIYDITTQRKNAPVNQYLSAFSVPRNFKAIFNTGHEKNEITCLPGLRFFSAFHVFFIHATLSFAYMPVINRRANEKEYGENVFAASLQTGLSVDTFFVISGLLVAMKVLRELDQRGGRVNFIRLYVERYVRVTPMFMMSVLFTIIQGQKNDSGPIKYFGDCAVETCSQQWFYTMFYLHNWMSPSWQYMCLASSWYLILDWYFFLLAPLLVFIMYKFKPCALAIVGGLIAIFISYSFTRFFMTGTGFMTADSLMNLHIDQSVDFYASAPFRISPWLVGIGLGYLLHNHKSTPIKLGTWTSAIIWLVSISITLYAVFGLYPFIQKGYEGDFYRAFYASIARTLWALSIAWLILACELRPDLGVNRFFSHPWLKPLGRLSYALYIWHAPIWGSMIIDVRSPLNVDSVVGISHFWGLIGTTLPIAIWFALAIEFPCINLVKRKSKVAANTPNEVANPQQPSVVAKEVNNN